MRERMAGWWALERQTLHRARYDGSVGRAPDWGALERRVVSSSGGPGSRSPPLYARVWGASRLEERRKSRTTGHNMTLATAEGRFRVFRNGDGELGFKDRDAQLDLQSDGDPVCALQPAVADRSRPRGHATHIALGSDPMMRTNVLRVSSHRAIGSSYAL